MTPGAIAQDWNTGAKRAETAEDMTDSLVDQCVTVWARALNHQAVLDIVRTADEEYGHSSIFDAPGKLQMKVQKAMDKDGFEHCGAAV